MPNDLTRLRRIVEHYVPNGRDGSARRKALHLVERIERETTADRFFLARYREHYIQSCATKG